MYYTHEVSWNYCFDKFGDDPSFFRISRALSMYKKSGEEVLSVAFFLVPWVIHIMSCNNACVVY